MSSEADANTCPTGLQYEDALRVLDRRKRLARPKPSHLEKQRFESSAQRPTRSGTPDLRGTPGILGMKEWLRLLGHSEDDLNSLNVVHVAGTKGKGSTCAFVESLLRTHGQRTGFPRKTGLYTSPHLMRPEERIRIDSKPLNPERFAQYFFEVCDRLPQLLEDYDATKPVIERGPRVLQLYALLAFHVFIREKIDVTILETHCGGDYDATNIVSRPLATVVTTLGMDHIDMLGPTIENIAWHKSGIYKSGSAALSTIQHSAPLAVLHERALAKGEQLRVIGIDSRLPKDTIQIQPLVQKQNASLAIAAAETYLERVPRHSSPFPASSELSLQDIDQGIRTFAWPGRFHIVPNGSRTWYLDAAHNDISVNVAAQWFAEVSRNAAANSNNNDKNGNSSEETEDVLRVLIFSHENELRNATALLNQLAKALERAHAGIQHVIFCPYEQTAKVATTTTIPTPAENRPRIEAAPGNVQQFEHFRQAWMEVFLNTQIWHERSVEEAMNRAETLGNAHSGLHVLVTGSQFLVGPALRILEARGVTI